MKSSMAMPDVHTGYGFSIGGVAAFHLKEGIVSQGTVDTDKSAYDQGKAQIALDSATIKQREAALKAARVNLGYTDIVSPVDGVVVSRNIDVGQTVAASFNTPE